MILKRFIPVLVTLITLAPDARGAEIPPAVARPVDFQKDVVPIFQASCSTCHSCG